MLGNILLVTDILPIDVAIILDIVVAHTNLLLLSDRQDLPSRLCERFVLLGMSFSQYFLERLRKSFRIFLVLFENYLSFGLARKKAIKPCLQECIAVFHGLTSGILSAQRCTSDQGGFNCRDRIHRLTSFPRITYDR